MLNKSNFFLHWLTKYYWIEGLFRCSGCRRNSSGFMYKCAVDFCNYQLDVRCASLPDTSIHESHPNHPIYLNLTKGKCMDCKSTSCSGEYLECVICDSFLGVKCATLPSVVHYKYDSHPLTLCHREKDTTNGQYWCEVCESKLDASEWFYTCDSCRVTLYVTCLLGRDMYMKPQHFFGSQGSGGVHEIALNDGNTRPFCYQCHKRCTDTLVFKYRNNYFCHLNCIIASY